MKVLTVSTFLPWLLFRGMPSIWYIAGLRLSRPHLVLFFIRTDTAVIAAASPVAPAPVVASGVPPASFHGSYLVLVVPFYSRVALIFDTICMLLIFHRVLIIFYCSLY